MSGKPPVAGAGQPLLHGTATSPPPYGSSGYHHHNQNHPHNHPHSYHLGHHGVAYAPYIHPAPVGFQPPAVVVVMDRPRYRFCKALIFAIITWFLICALVRSIILLAHWGHGHGHGPIHRHWAVGLGSKNYDYPVPNDTDLISCEEPLKYSRSAETTLDVSASSDTVLLFASGPKLHGTVRVTTTTEHRDSVRISVGLESRLNFEAYTIVCSVKREDGERGVGIFNPSRAPRPDNTVRYDIVVEFPENHPVVNRFESSVINSVYNIDDLQGKISFKELSVRGTNGGIHSGSLFAQWADIRTSNGRIDGYFNASDWLSLRTSNSQVDVDVDFNQENAARAELSITTSNSPLKARVHLYDLTSSKNLSSSFSVTGKTSNSPLNIAFLDAPLDSKLVHRASTSNSPAEVSLHPTFEGQFYLHSSLFGAVVHERPGVEDPSGKGRERRVRYRTIRGPRAEGSVTWGDDVDEEKLGNVEVGSSNARVTLNL